MFGVWLGWGGVQPRCHGQRAVSIPLVTTRLGWGPAGGVCLFLFISSCARSQSRMQINSPGIKQNYIQTVTKTSHDPSPAKGTFADLI